MLCDIVSIGSVSVISIVSCMVSGWGSVGGGDLCLELGLIVSIVLVDENNFVWGHCVSL